MNQHDLIQLLLFVAILFGAGPFLGKYIYLVFSEKKPLQFLNPLEKFFYKTAGINPNSEMHWTHYLGALLIFNLFGFLAVLGLQLFQEHLPLNPQGFKNVEFWLAVNTAISFMTNTNWQAYSGEGSLSNLVQMLGLGVQNFLSATTGLAVMLVIARGIVRKGSGSLGNFWSDTVKGTLYILLPLSLILAVVLVSQGVVQTFTENHTIHTLIGQEQVIPVGPAASQIAIKQVGTNGGGFFGVNSAHPFENPTPLANFLEMLSILLLPVAQLFTFGRLIQNRKHAMVLLSVMSGLLALGFGVSYYSEASSAAHVGLQSLMEGKEVRFGVFNSVLWETITTAASNGSVNAMHDSFSPLSILVGIANMMTGEVIFGGVGAGLYGMILYVILTIFLVGLMVGRTPEYLGKKIESSEIRWTMAALLIPNLTILIGVAIALSTTTGLSSILNTGPHGLSEIIYAFSSAAGNNGSALGGLTVNTPFYNISLSIAMFLGRFGVIIPIIAIAGLLARKNICADNEGTFKADNGLFAVILSGSLIIVGALTFVPLLLLGPIIEHLLMLTGKVF